LVAFLIGAHAIPEFNYNNACRKRFSQRIKYEMSSKVNQILLSCNQQLIMIELLHVIEQNLPGNVLAANAANTHFL